jgi:hypothetical protein
MLKREGDENVPAKRQCPWLIALLVVAHAADLHLSRGYATLAFSS